MKIINISLFLLLIPISLNSSDLLAPPDLSSFLNENELQSIIEEEITIEDPEGLHIEQKIEISDLAQELAKLGIESVSIKDNEKSNLTSLLLFMSQETHYGDTITLRIRDPKNKIDTSTLERYMQLFKMLIFCKAVKFDMLGDEIKNINALTTSQ